MNKLAWISFATDDDFLGVLVIPAGSMVEIMVYLIFNPDQNPGGEMLATFFPDDGMIPENYRGRLLSAADLKKMDADCEGSIGPTRLDDLNEVDMAILMGTFDA